MKKTIATLALATGIAIAAVPAHAGCRLFTPTGVNGSTNIRSGPSLDFGIQDRLVNTGDPVLSYCGRWSADVNGRVDDNGEPLFWMLVQYNFGGYEHTGWIASIVAGTPYD